MTAITLGDKRQCEEGDGPVVWRCESCRCFHLRAGHVLLTLTPEEFADFTRTVADCYVAQEMHRLVGALR